MYSILPASKWKEASVYLMLIHNAAAFTLHVQPLMFIWERIIHTQKLPFYLRLPSRLPAGEVLVDSQRGNVDLEPASASFQVLSHRLVPAIRW